ncbi:protein kinase [Corallococcus sp. NCSPR001]|nr:protein kinase [Corallococcus sp. NCSPR001]WAS89476.1 protein kinase [Corallococcus sp. NCRR]
MDLPRLKRARTMLEEQGRLATYLEYPAILRVHGLRTADRGSYVITDHPSGHGICNLLSSAGECVRRFSPLFTLHVGTRVAEALEHAHEANDEEGGPLHIVHRALDMEHLFVNWNGKVQVSDFGLALSGRLGRVSSTVRWPQRRVLFLAGNAPDGARGGTLGPLRTRSRTVLLGFKSNPNPPEQGTCSRKTRGSLSF